MSFPTPFFYLMEGLADVKEKAASLDAATVKMKLEDHTASHFSVSLSLSIVSCCNAVYRAGSLFCKAFATRRLGSSLVSANQLLKAFLCGDSASLHNMICSDKTGTLTQNITTIESNVGCHGHNVVQVQASETPVRSRNSMGCVYTDLSFSFGCTLEVTCVILLLTGDVFKWPIIYFSLLIENPPCPSSWISSAKWCTFSLALMQE